MIYPDLKKWTSLFIIFAFLANQCSPLYAANTNKRSSNQQNSSSSALSQRVASAAQAAVPRDDEWYVEDAKKAVNKTCMKIKDPHNVNRQNVGGCIAPLKKFEKDALAWNKKILQSTTCVGGEKGSAMYCYPTVALARGIIRSVLQKNPNENKFMLFETASELSDFTKLIYLYGVQSAEDLKLAVKFCTDVISFYGSSCDGNGKGANSRCNAQISAVLAVSALNLKGNGAYIKSAQDAVYSFLKKNYEGSGGAPMKVAVIALATINTKGSWRYIEQFLTKDSHPGILSETLDILTPITLVTNAAAKVKAIEKWGSTSYRNKTVDQFMYVDWKENKRQGGREKAQYPYGNMLEDIGHFLGEKAAVNPEARRVAQEIMNHANGWAKSRKRIKGARYMDATLHWPVVIGILDGYRKHGKKFIYVPSPELLSILYNGDFWDLNEGTQRRIHHKAYLFAKARGWGWKDAQLDSDKITRSNQTAKAIKWAKIADIAVIVMSVGVGLLSKIPVVSKGMIQAGTYLNATKARMFKSLDFAKILPRQGKSLTNAGKELVAPGTQEGVAASEELGGMRRWFRDNWSTEGKQKAVIKEGQERRMASAQKSQRETMDAGRQRMKQIQQQQQSKKQGTQKPNRPNKGKQKEAEIEVTDQRYTRDQNGKLRRRKKSSPPKEEAQKNVQSPLQKKVEEVKKTQEVPPAMEEEPISSADAHLQDMGEMHVGDPLDGRPLGGPASEKIPAPQPSPAQPAASRTSITTTTPKTQGAKPTAPEKPSASAQSSTGSEHPARVETQTGVSAERPSHVQNSTSSKMVEPQPEKPVVPVEKPSGEKPTLPKTEENPVPSADPQPELSPIQFVKQGSQSFSQASGKIIQDARPLHEGVPALEHDISLLEGQAFRQFPQRGTVSTVAQQYRIILRSEPIENIVNTANRLAPTLNRTEKIMDDAVAALETGSKGNLANLTQKLDAQINELQAIRVELDNSVSAAQQTIAKFRPGPEYVDYTEAFKPLEQNLSSYLEVGSGVSNDINTLIKDLTAIKAQLLKVK